MLKIGVIGNPGSGKTTFSEYLTNRYQSVAYLNVDKVTSDNAELLATRNKIVWYAFNKSVPSEILKEMQLNYRNKLNQAVLAELGRIENSGKDIVLIDYSVLYSLPGLWDSVQYKIHIFREEEQRKEGLLKREGEKHIQLLDTFVQIACVNMNSIDVDFKIENNGDLEHLYTFADKIYNEILLREHNLMPTRHFSYYIVKPDGIRYFKEIYESLNDIFIGMESVHVFKIKDYFGIMKKLYYQYFQKYPDIFPEMYESYQVGINSLYGRDGLLIVVSELHKTKGDEQVFFEKILSKKLKIREKLMDPNVLILERISNSSPLQGEDTIYLNGNKYRIDIPKSLSRLHCPEDNKEETICELEILFKSGIIDAVNLLGAEDIKNVAKYGSVKGFTHDCFEQNTELEKRQRNKIVQSLSIEFKKYVEQK